MRLVLVIVCGLLLSTAYAFIGTTLKQHATLKVSHQDTRGSHSFFTTTLMAALSPNTIPTDIMTPRQLVQVGEQSFKKGNVDESIALFDKAEQLNTNVTPYLWQRGISYYYAKDFEKGSRQFRLDVRVNPLDVEEIVWDIACQEQLKNKGIIEKVEKLALPQGRTDRRKIMVRGLSYINSRTGLGLALTLTLLHIFKLMCLSLHRALFIPFFGVMEPRNTILRTLVTVGVKVMSFMHNFTWVCFVSRTEKNPKLRAT